MEVEDILRALGAEVVGPFRRLEPALGAVQKEVHGAVLDVQLDGETSEESPPNWFLAAYGSPDDWL